MAEIHHRFQLMIATVRDFLKRSRPGRPWLWCLLLVAAVIIAFQPAWTAGFVWDDDDYVTRNPLLSAPDGLWRIWFSTDSPSQYFPLVYTTFRLEYALWGLNASGFHWVNILLHAANALLVWRLLSRLSLPAAWLGAALFALHPVQVESVAWISELKNIQSLFFFLLSLLCWVEFVSPAGRRRWFILALLLHALALLSKTTACTLPAALVLILWLKHIPVTRRRWLQIAPFVALSLAMGLLTVWWERHHQGTGDVAFSYGLLERGLIASRSYCFYLGKLLWPAGLTFNYPLWPIDATVPSAWLHPLLVVLLAGLLLFSLKPFGRGPAAAFTYHAAMLSPLLGFVMLYTFKYTFVADHYQYAALIGPAALAACGLHAIRPRLGHLACGSLAALLLLGLGFLSWRQAHIYRDLETLWTATIQQNPASYMGHNNLGAIYLQRGEVDRAITRFESALAILPDHGNAHGNLAHALLQNGEAERAVAHFRRAVEIEPRVAKPHSDLAHGLIALGRLDEARDHAQTALQLQPGFPEALLHLGRILLANGRLDDAIAHFNAALAGNPDFPEAHHHLGVALFQQNRLPEAVLHLQLATVLQPLNCELQNNLGWALLSSGRTDEAITCFETALARDPGFAPARCNLALALQLCGRLPEAVTHYETVLRAQPGNIAALSGLSWLLSCAPGASLRDGPRALALARRACELAGETRPDLLQVLAAAHAGCRDFPSAIATAEAALRSASGPADSAFASALHQQLQSYRSGAPFLLPAPTSGQPTP